MLDLVGKPFDYALFRLEREADKRGKRLENFSKYIHLCTVLTKLDFDEPVPFKVKEQCYHDMLALVEWVFIGDCISASVWLHNVIAEYNDMRVAQ